MKNYFSLLFLDTNFTIDEAALQANYVRAQQQSHPDRLVGKSDAERGIAIQHSMDVNDAYEVLQNPLKRAQHLLELRGVIVNTDHDTVKPSPTLLMEVMELREQLGGVQNEADAALVVKDLKSEMNQVSDSLAEAFEKDADHEAAQQTMRLRYLGKSLEEAYAKQYHLKAAS